MITHASLGTGFLASKTLFNLIGLGQISFAGNIRLKIYGTIGCKTGKRLKVANRVFFKSMKEVSDAGYRPCGNCMRSQYLLWKQQTSILETTNLIPHHGIAHLYDSFFPKQEADTLFKELAEKVPWKQEPIKMFGKEIMQPRLTCWYSDPGIIYSYSGIRMESQLWIKPLLEIKNRIERLAGVRFNGALLNFYRDGKDGMGWHRDNEKELGTNPVIGSVSLGGTRTFKLRDRLTRKENISLDLSNGSLLIMAGESQHFWEHSIPKQSESANPRINITFRVVQAPAGASS